MPVSNIHENFSIPIKPGSSNSLSDLNSIENNNNENELRRIFGANNKYATNMPAKLPLFSIHGDDNNNTLPPEAANYSNDFHNCPTTVCYSSSDQSGGGGTSGGSTCTSTFDSRKRSSLPGYENFY